MNYCYQFAVCSAVLNQTFYIYIWYLESRNCLHYIGQLHHVVGLEFLCWVFVGICFGLLQDKFLGLCIEFMPCNIVDYEGRHVFNCIFNRILTIDGFLRKIPNHQP